MALEDLLKDIDNAKDERELRLIEEKINAYYRKLVYFTKSLVQLHENKQMAKERLNNSENICASFDEWIAKVEGHINLLKI